MGNIKFTKRDMLVVVGCVCFMIATMGSIGSGGRRRAKEMICVANLHRWGKIFQSFVQDHDGRLMGRDGANQWTETLWSYFDGRTNLLLCPDARRTYYEGGVNPHMAWSNEFYISDYGVIKSSYTINLWISNNGSPYWGTIIGGGSKVPMFGDGQWKDSEPYPDDDPPEYESSMWTPNQHEMQRVCVNRHNGGVNLLYMDLSVRKLGLKHLWAQRWHRQWPVMGTVENPFPVWPEWMSNFKDPE